MTLVNGIVSFLAMILNIAQIALMIHKKKTKVPFEKTLLSLAFADSLASISHCLFFALTYLHFRGFVVIPRVAIGLLASLVAFSIYSSLIHSIFIAVQRIYAVLLPFKFRIHFTSAVCLVSIVVVWAVSLTLSVFVIYLENFIGHPFIIVAVSGVLVLCYIMICYHVRVQRRRAAVSANPQQQNDLACRTLVYSILVTAAFLICMLPNAIYILSRSDSVFAQKFTELMFTLNSVADSLLYFVFPQISQKKCCCFPGNTHRVRMAEPLAVTSSSCLELPQIYDTRL